MEERIIKDINNLLTQLFQKMKEAGYEWNAEKKELRKIEQKPADKSKIKPKFKTGDRVIGVISGMSYFITKVCDDHYNTESGCIIMFSSQDNFELYELKPAWSERDELMLEASISFIKSSPYPYFGDTLRGEISKIEAEDWLKSLKDRVQPQPKQEWSKEDEVMIKVFNSIIRYIVEVVDKDALERFGTKREELFSWLKSLRPQNTWKPSKEQIKCLDNVKGSDDHNGYVLNTLYNDLKKLREE